MIDKLDTRIEDDADKSELSPENQINLIIIEKLNEVIDVVNSQQDDSFTVKKIEE